MRVLQIGGDRMVDIKLDEKSKEVEKQLGKLKDQAPRVICYSINDTAKWAQRAIAHEARKAYNVKVNGMRHDMKMKRATYTRLEAVLLSHGAPLPLKDFKNNVTKGGTKATVLKQGSSGKPLIIDGKKGFFNKIGHNTTHQGIAQRTGEYTIEKTLRNHIRSVLGKKVARREKIRELHGPSIVNMLGDEKRVYGVVEPQMEAKLTHYLELHIKKTLEGYEK